MEVSEYELARKIHRSMLPPHTVNEKVDFIMAYREFNMLGGDYCTAHWQ